MAFESGIVSEEWRSTVQGEKTERSNYIGISLLSVVAKIYAGILVDRVHKVTEGLMTSKGGSG